MNLIFIGMSPMILLSALLQRGDVLISEVLFNPREGGVDFVEIYNYSSKTIDVRDLMIGSVDRERRVSNVIPLTATRTLFYPGTYLVLTTRPDLIQAHYPDVPQNSLMAVDRLPAFSNHEGTVILLSRWPSGSGDDYRVLDSLHYAATMHSPFLNNVKGISLERQDFGTPADVPGNFRSAALSVGGATPGFANSAALPDEVGIQLKSRIVTPDQDGLNDDLELHYALPLQNLMATIRIYDIRGRVVRTLMQHMSIPSRGIWKWDGMTDQRQPVRESLYTVYIELYNSQGFRKDFRKSFVIVRRK